MKIGIIGPESTGKTTLARQLAEQFHGQFIPEYGRIVLEQKGSKDVSYDELCAIARHQIDELASLDTRPASLCFFDTELIVTKVWFEYAFGEYPGWLQEAIERYPMDFYLLTAPDIPWVPDPTRSNGSDTIRQELFARYEEEIQTLQIPYYIIEH